MNREQEVLWPTRKQPRTFSLVRSTSNRGGGAAVRTTKKMRKNQAFCFSSVCEDCRDKSNAWFLCLVQVWEHLRTALSHNLSHGPFHLPAGRHLASFLMQCRAQVFCYGPHNDSTLFVLTVYGDSCR